MSKTNKMLIDASHKEETRVVVLKDGKVDEFDFESAARKLLKGSIFLAKVTRVEPSLQAAFVDYGGNRHGFLAFNEIHPDYYQIPFADRQALMEAEAAERAAEAKAEAEADARAEAQEAARKKRSKSRKALASDDDDAEDADDVHDIDDDDTVDDLDAAGDDHDDDIDGDDDADDAHVETVERDAASEDDDDREDDDDDFEVIEAQAIDVTELLPAEDDTRDDADADADGAADDNSGPAKALATSEDERVTSDVTDSDDDDRDDADDGDGDQDGVDAKADDETAEGSADCESDGEAEPENGDDADSEAAAIRKTTRRRMRSYKIQEVIRRRQVVLVQVVKEERGTKGAALTTYLSLAGRYTVLMPNTGRGGGISRKITNGADRKRLKAIAEDLDVPEGMGLIIRTAGASRTKQEIKRDFEYLLRLWENVRDLTLESSAPALVYEEGNLIKRSIRDLYSKDIDEIVVAGDEAHREAKDFMRMLMPSHAKNVTRFDESGSLFGKFRIETQLGAMFSPIVTLPSGGYLVINQTEALVAIDINSGRATREFSIEETALKTNLEAAEEISRQLKLRDLAGLVVIDFIDMDEKRNNRAVERKIKDCLKLDRARIQVGRISHFGLLEMSRQRLRTGVLEGSTTQCAHCQGTGIIRSVESIALAVLRGVEDALDRGAGSMTANCAPEVAFYLLNEKRAFLADLETRFTCTIAIVGNPKEQGASFTINSERPVAAEPEPSRQRSSRSAVRMDRAVDQDEETRATGEDGDDERKPRRRRRRRGGRGRDNGAEDQTDELAADSSDDDAGGADETDDEETQRGRRSRRRGRRGGQRNRNGAAGDTGDVAAGDTVDVAAGDTVDVAAGDTVDVADPDAPQPVVGDLSASDNGDGRGDDTADESYEGQAETAVRAANAVRRRAGSERSGSGDGRRRGGRRGRGRSGGREASDQNEQDAAGDIAEAVSTNGHAADAEPADVTPDAPALETANGANGSGTAAEPSATDTKPMTNGDASREPNGAGPSPAAEEPAPRPHWGEPKSSAPTVERVTLAPESNVPGDDAQAPPPKPQKKGWWQRNFG